MSAPAGAVTAIAAACAVIAAVVTALFAWISERQTARFISGLSPAERQAVRDFYAHRPGTLQAALDRLAVADWAVIAVLIGGPRRRPARPAAGLLAAAGWLLPAGSRARYAEELAAELHELAASGAGPGRQARYALRQLLAAPRTGLALRRPRRRRRAVP